MLAIDNDAAESIHFSWARTEVLYTTDCKIQAACGTLWSLESYPEDPNDREAV